MGNVFISNADIISHHKVSSPLYNALWIEDGIIKAVGNTAELISKVNDNTTVIDAGGKTLMPGFNDSHIHIWKVGNLKTYMLDVRGVSSKSALLDLLSDYMQAFPDAHWITARGFNEAAWADKQMPDKNDLDSITTTRPIYLIRTCAHIAVCNTLALQMAGINDSTIPPPGGEIRKGDNGKPNGIISETALGLVTKHIPPPTKEQLKTMVLAARNEMYSYGITAATDPAVDPLLLEAYFEMATDNNLGFRLNVLPIILPDGGSEPYPLPNYFDSAFLKLNTVKFFSDGGLSGKTASLKRTYKDSVEKGVLRLEADQYMMLCRKAMEKGLGVATHAIGDAAIAFIVDVYASLHQDFPGILKRIEHLGLPAKADMEQMAKHHIAASMQTIFLDELGRNFIQYLDAEYLLRCYPVKTALDYGVQVALSSDAPVVKNFNPLKGAAAATTRQTQQGDLIAPAEAITVQQALTAYTQTPAEISKLNHYGYIGEGALADFILLNQNPLLTKPGELEQIQVTSTFVAGDLVWQQDV